MSCALRLRRAAACALALGLAAEAGCDLREQALPAPAAAPTARRAIEPGEGRSTARLPRVQIESETRLVLGAAPRLVLLWQQPIELSQARDGFLEITAPPGAAAKGGSSLLVEAWVSLDDPGVQAAGAGDLAGLVAERQTLRAEPRLVAATDLGSVSARIPLPDAATLRGSTGLANLAVRPLADTPLASWPTRAFEVAEGDRLVFGYGVEREGWGEGWPPLAFRVEAQDEAGAAPRVLFSQQLDPAEREPDRGWHDASVELSSLAGRRVRFVFSAEAIRAQGRRGPLRSFGVVSHPELVSRAASARRNLVLISLDTLRAFSVSAYGNERETTPAFDARIAGRGALVRSAVTPFPYTPPAHASMLTGLDVCAHGIEDRHDRLGANRITLAEALRADGFRTAAFTENGYVVAGAGFARGFDTYHELLSEERAAPGFAEQTFGRAEQWLESVDSRPFFLFIHTYQVHGPYTPPPAYRGLFSDAVTAGYSSENRAALDDYEREVRYTDDLLGRFLDALEARGLAERSVVVVTSDHGEQFGEHFFTGHGFDLHDEALLVPLAVRAPGLVPAGIVVEEQVGLVDVTPTLLELLGTAPLPDVQGRSFAGLLTGAGARAADFVERPLVGKASHSRSLRTRSYKYSEGTAKSEWRKLYHLEADPKEQHELSASDPESVGIARKLLREQELACEAWLRAHPADGDEGDASFERPGWMINRDEIERKLRSLGYVE